MTEISKQKTSSPAQSANDEAGFSLISDEKLLQIYTIMLQCRMMEERASLIRSQDRLESDFSASAGQEASSAAIVIELQKSDLLCLGENAYIPAFVKGVGAESLFRALANPQRSKNKIAATQLTAEMQGVGVVLASPVETRSNRIREFALDEKGKARGCIAVVFLNAKSALLEPWLETMSLAGSKKLPIIFVREASSHIEQQSSTAKSQRSAPPDAMVNGIPAIHVDGSDAVALFRVASEAIARARQGRGSTLIECSLFPEFQPNEMSPDSIYKKEIPKPNPVLIMEKYLNRKGLWNEGIRQTIFNQFNQQLDLATRFLND